MQRREFITLLGGAAAAWPLAARAQQPAMPVIGFLSGASQQTIAPLVAAFLKGLGATGYFEGRSIAIEYRWGADELDRLPALAVDLTNRHVSAIVCHSDLAIIAAKAATTTIPIVFLTGADPVRAGFVASLNRPGGNLTGMVFLNADLGPKRLGLLREIVPKAAVIAVLVDQNFKDAASQLAELKKAAGSLGQEIIPLNARTASDIDQAFATLVQQRAGALLLLGGNLFNVQRQQIIALAARHSVPTIYFIREFAESGGLISYGTRIADSFHEAGIYTGRILRGEKPADMPVLQPTKFELVINLKTATALGLTIPPGVLAIADEVIE
jgi:ABC-type uncharacterized transport system substrate-binding protein